jgi:hypothetical protein
MNTPRRPTHWRKSLCLVALCLVPARAALAAPAGSLDPGFSGDGIAVTPIGVGDLPKDVAVQSDGRIVVVGSTDSASATNWFAARYLSVDSSIPLLGPGARAVLALTLLGALALALKRTRPLHESH